MRVVGKESSEQRNVPCIDRLPAEDNVLGKKSGVTDVTHQRRLVATNGSAIPSVLSRQNPGEFKVRMNSGK